MRMAADDASVEKAPVAKLTVAVPAAPLSCFAINGGAPDAQITDVEPAAGTARAFT